VTNSPADLTVPPGTNATFTVGASGTRLTYQWFKGTNFLTNETNSSLTLTNVSASDAGLYCVTVSGICTNTNTCASLTVQCLPSPGGLVGWWQGETNGYEAVNGNNATLCGVTFTNGEVGGAFSFDGSSAYGCVPACSNLDVGPGPGLTIECWINPADIYTPGPLVAWDGGWPMVVLWANEWDSGVLSADIGDMDWDGGSVWSDVDLLNPGSFQHVAVTYDQSSGNAILYCNGTAVATNYLGSFTPFTSCDLYLGGDPSCDAFYYGLLDEVGVYSRALGPDEIRAIYDAANLGRCGITPRWIVQPASQSATVGNDVVFNSLAAGTSLGYQWFFNGNAMAGATSPRLTLTNLRTNDAGTYSVHVSGGGTLSLISSNAVLTVNPANCYLAPTGLVSWWRAESNALDSAGGNNGSLSNGVSFVAGKVGQAFSFNGLDQSVEIPYAPALASTTFTIEAWVNPSGQVSWWLGQAFIFGQAYGRQLVVRTGCQGLSVAVQVLTSPWNIYQVDSSGEIPIGEWTHLVGTWDGTSLSLYINGALDQQVTPGIVPWDSDCSFSIGGINGPCAYFGQYFPGLIDEVGYYNRALSASEIAGLYNASSAGKCQNPPTITVQPANQNIGLGSNATFTVSATGTPQLHYQWRFNGTNLPGATLTALTLTNVQFAQAGTYAVQVTNAFGSALSSNAVLTITNSAMPVVQITNPINQTIVVFTTNTLIATASSPNGPIHWVQFFAGTNYLGYTTTGTNNVYQILWRPLFAGTCVLQAQAADTSGSNSWSATVTNVVRALPAVAITNPVNGAIFGPSPTNITINATASADGTNISNVVFYQGTNILGNSASPPYSITWSNVSSGAYSLSAAATDGRGAMGISPSVSITVDRTNQPPFVYAGPDQTIVLPSNATLAGTVSDDGLPRGNSLTTWWTRSSGPGSVTFGSPTNALTTASFTVVGTNVLQLAASDGQYSTTSSVTVVVLTNNLPPVVNAGTNQTVILPALANTNPLPYILVSMIMTNAAPYAFGVDYHAPSNCLAVSCRFNTSSWCSNSLYLIATNGAQTSFSPLVRVYQSEDETKIVTVRDTLGGFDVGDLFCGNGNPGEVVRIKPDGTIPWTNGIPWPDLGHGNAWVVLPYDTNDDTGILQGAMCVDRTGVFGGDLIVADQGGVIWRVDSNGVATVLTQLVTNMPTFDGMVTLPNDPERYGPWAGRILVGANNGSLYAVDTNGSFVTYDLNIPDVEEILVIPENENFFVVDCASVNGDGYDALWSAGAFEFQGMAGDLLVADEEGQFFRVHWNGTWFDVQLIAAIADANGVTVEHATFAPVGILNQPGIGQIQLGGCVSDDGLLWPTNVISWIEESGPGPVTFADPTKTNTIATFSILGTYYLRLSAYDGQFTSYTNVMITVLRNQAPSVDAGTNQVIATNSTTLYGSVSDDGLPYGETNLVWSQISGPGTAAFTSSNQPITGVSFNTGGVYVLRLTADDGQATNAAEVIVTVESASLVLTPAYELPACSDAPYTVTARLVDAYNNPIAGTNITLSVSNLYYGDIFTNYTGVTDSNGTIRFFYNGRVGHNFIPDPDHLLATATNNGQVLTATAEKVWAGEVDCGPPGAEIYSGEAGLSMTLPGHSAVYCRFTGFAGSPVTITNGGDPAILVVVRDPINRIVATSLELPLMLTPALTGDYLIEAIEADATIAPVYVSLSLSCGIPSPQIQILFAGTNVPNGASIGFPTTPVLQPVTNTFTITNLSTYIPWYIDSVTTFGDFTPTNLSGSEIGILPNSSTNLDVVFDASSAGPSFGWLAVTCSGAGFAETIYLFGNAWPTGAPPSVQLTSPAAGTAFFSPATIPITAVVTPGLTNVSYVEFHAGTTNGVVTLGRTSTGISNSYTFLWPNVAAGDYTLTASAVDVQGRTGTASPVLVHVNSSNGNHPPIANLGYFIVLAESQNNVLPVLTNDIDPDGDPLTITAVIPPATTTPHGTATITNNGTAIAYTPPPDVHSPVGSPGDGFSYQISDGRGGTALGGVLVYIFAGDLPSVTIVSPTNDFITSGGAVVPITAQVTNTPYVVKVQFYLGQTLLGTVTNGTAGNYTFNWIATDDACGCAFTATAYDRFGQYNTSLPLSFTVNVSTSIDLLVASIDSLVNTTTNYGFSFLTNMATLRDGRFDLYGRACQPQGSNVTWQLGVYTTDGTLLRDLTPPPLDASGNNTNYVGTSTSSNLMTTCDFTTLLNGVYDLRLRVVGGYRAAESSVRFRLESNLKIGQFGFSQQDLVIPVNGIPLTITRTYNSLKPDRGDFGYGWTWALSDMDVVLDESRANVPDLTNPNSTPFSERTGGGRDVTLTLPNGQRTTFTFYFGGQQNYGFPAQWQAAPGVTAQLTAQGNNVLTAVNELGGGNPYWEADSDVPMDNFDFPGFILTTLDGTQYIINRQDLHEHGVADGDYTVHAYGKPSLARIKQLTGDQILISTDSIIHLNPTNGVTSQIALQRNADGLITAIYDPNSGVTNAQSQPAGFPSVRYEYDSSQNLMDVQTLKDRTAGTYVTNTFTYTNLNFPHYITSIINADGTQVAKNFYDNSGRLIATQDADGNTTQFLHSTTNNTEVVIDRLGHTNIYAYDLQGNVTATTNALGGITLSAYDYNNNKTNEISFLNGQPYATNRYVFDTTNLLLVSYNPLGYSNVFTYNANGQVLTSTDARGNTTTSYYDSQTGNLLGTSDALGDATTNSYDSNGLLISSQDAAGTLTLNAYDGWENLTGTAVYDALGRILSTNSFTYDDNGNRITSTVWRGIGGVLTGAMTTYVYDGQNRVVQTINPDGGTNTVFYNDIGKQAQTIDPLGRPTSYAYDDQGRLVSTTYPDLTTETSAYDSNGNRTQSADGIGWTTTYVYDALNRLTQTIFPDTTSSLTVYDDLGRVASSVDARGTTTAFGYDVAGRRVAVTNAWVTSVQMTNGFAFDPNGNQITSTDALGRTTTNVFDTLNRVVQVLYPDGTKTATGYDSVGRRVAQTNQDRIVTLFGYDGAGRLVVVTNNALSTNSQMVTRYQYDEAGNEIAQIDALGRTTSFAYDLMGRRIRRTLPGNQLETMGYDLAGNLILATNFNGVIITNQYDAMNRLTNRSSIGGYQVSFTYTPTGQRQSMNDPSGATKYAYDSRGRLQFKLVSWSGGPSVSLNYLYDANGNVTDIWSSTPGGANLHYDYDPLNRITNVLSAGSVAARYGFDLVGNLKSVQYANGVTNLYQYDALNRLTNLVWQSGTANLASFYYQLGSTGNRTNLSESINDQQSTTNRSYAWQYDSLYRLTNETISALGTLGYRYDLVGNRTNRTSISSPLPSTSSTYNTNDWLTTDQYDNNGNTTWSTNADSTVNGPYFYDVENRLTNYNNDVYLSYNGDGVRVQKTVEWVTTCYLVDDRNPTGYPQVLEELTSDPSPLLFNVYTYGLTLVSQQTFYPYSNSPPSTCYFVTDGHGSTRLLLDANAAVTGTFAYDAYGTLIVSNSTPATAYLYCGEQFDPDLGLYYLRARYFNPNTGRFWTMDTDEGDQEDPQSLHKYLYCDGNVINKIDPLGLYVAVITSDGERTVVPNNAAALFVELKLVNKLHKHVAALIIAGHGGPRFITLDAAQDYQMTAAGPSVTLIDGSSTPNKSWEIAGLLHQVLSPSARILLRACDTASGVGNIAEDMSSLFPTATVVGYNGPVINFGLVDPLYDIMLNGNVMSFGNEVIYKNGQVYKPILIVTPSSFQVDVNTASVYIGYGNEY
jgi:RHS repeat-associated protein